MKKPHPFSQALREVNGLLSQPVTLLLIVWLLTK